MSQHPPSLAPISMKLITSDCQRVPTIIDRSEVQKQFANR